MERELVTIPRTLYDEVLAKLRAMAARQTAQEEANLLREQVDALYRMDAVERGMTFSNNYPRQAGGKFGFGPGTKAGGGAGAGGGTGKGAAGGAGKGGGAKKAAGGTKSTKTTKAAKAGGGGSGGGASTSSAKAPTIEEQKAAAELRLKNAKTRANKAEREFKAAEKEAEEKRQNNAAEINRLQDEQHEAFLRNFNSHGEAKDAIAEERARAKGESGKAPQTYARMLAAKQPYEDAKANYETLKAKADVSKAHLDALEKQYDQAGYVQKYGYNWHDRMAKDHPDYKAAYTQKWKDESARDKAMYAMYRKQGAYERPRDQLAGKISEADIAAHPTHAANAKALADADARLGEATGQTRLHAAFQERENARAELRDAQLVANHPTWNYPLRSAPTQHANYTDPDKWPDGALKAAHGKDSGGGLDRHVGDVALSELQHAQGFDGKPDIVTEAELDQFVKNGEVEMWRGDTNRSANYTDQLMMGDEHHAGLGIRGSGTYTQDGKADGYGVARGYANDRGTNGGGKGLVMRMSLKSDARTITLDRLQSMAHKAVENAKKEEQDARARGDKKALEHAQLMKWLGSPRDNGASRYAVAMGYDAISVPQHGQWIILNRTALRISHQVRSG